MAHVGATFLHPVFPRRGAFLWRKKRELVSLRAPLPFTQWERTHFSPSSSHVVAQTPHMHLFLLLGLITLQMPTSLNPTHPRRFSSRSPLWWNLHDYLSNPISKPIQHILLLTGWLISCLAVSPASPSHADMHTYPALQTACSPRLGSLSIMLQQSYYLMPNRPFVDWINLLSISK